MGNWFIGLPVAAGAWFDAIEPPPGVRKFGRDDLHLTVAFLGAIPAQAARRAFAHEFPLAALTIELGEVELLGASAISALLRAGRSEVERAIGETRSAYYAAAEARPDPRPPLAHATFARTQRRITPAQRRDATAWARALDLAAPPILLERIALYTWSDDRTQSLFRIDASRPLTRSA